MQQTSLKISSFDSSKVFVSASIPSVIACPLGLRKAVQAAGIGLTCGYYFYYFYMSFFLFLLILVILHHWHSFDSGRENMGQCA